jgi:hypothetical protein
MNTHTHTFNIREGTQGYILPLIFSLPKFAYRHKEEEPTYFCSNFESEDVRYEEYEELKH